MSERISGPENWEEKAKEVELEKMMAEVSKSVSIRAIEKERPSPNTTLTPTEHKLIGSSIAGQGYHPNMPLAFAHGSELLAVNNVRHGSEDAPRTILFSIDRKVFIKCRLLPLSESDLSNPNAAVKFEIVSAEDPRGNALEVPADALEQLEEKMKQAQQDARERLKKEIEGQ